LDYNKTLHVNDCNTLFDLKYNIDEVSELDYFSGNWEKYVLENLLPTAKQNLIDKNSWNLSCSKKSDEVFKKPATKK
jgi:hypothetical protein